MPGNGAGWGGPSVTASDGLCSGGASNLRRRSRCAVTTRGAGMPDQDRTFRLPVTPQRLLRRHVLERGIFVREIICLLVE
ncbi:hypothetical protein B0G77_3320 [Paraburkholderia sp. BL10I2N1]|nr:hypothetical protein B0G77_3320 [Paraburkholderia sp. BL10I2N1]